MATRKKQEASDVPDGVEAVVGPRPRLAKLIVKNFRCIGDNPVEVDLDDIVVLVGPNNVGKSSILRAYEVVMLEGSKEGELALDDFPNNQIVDGKYPEIELHTIIFDNTPGEEWILHTSANEKLVRERWTWKQPGKAERRGFNVNENRWANDSDKEKVPWGTPTVANSRRPQPHRVNAFDSPDKQAKEITDILIAVLNDRLCSTTTILEG